MRHLGPLRPDRGKDLGQWRVIRGMGIDVRIPHLGSRTDDERRTELVDTLAALLDSVTIPVGADGTLQAPRIEQELCEVDALERCRSRRLRGVVDQHRERDLLIVNERLRVPFIAGADRNDFGAHLRDLVVVATQLRGMLAAEQSAEMAQENQDHDPVRPVVAQPVSTSVGAGELDLLEPLEIHTAGTIARNRIQARRRATKTGMTRSVFVWYSA
jgi:hypothetical protein